MTIIENSIRIVKGGTIQGDDKSTGATLPASDTYISYGGAAVLWGLAWTATDINAANFGVVYSAKSNIGNTSHYLKATNFGFTIPVGATIDGILVEIEQKYDVGAFECKWPKVDHIRITVYYTTEAEDVDWAIGGDHSNEGKFKISHFSSLGTNDVITITEDENVGIGTTTPGSKLAVVGLPIYANNAAAITGGLAAGDFYRTNADPDPVCVVH